MEVVPVYKFTLGNEAIAHVLSTGAFQKEVILF